MTWTIELSPIHSSILIYIPEVIFIYIKQKVSYFLRFYCIDLSLPDTNCHPCRLHWQTHSSLSPGTERISWAEYILPITSQYLWIHEHLPPGLSVHELSWTLTHIPLERKKEEQSRRRKSKMVSYPSCSFIQTPKTYTQFAFSLS